MLVKSLFLLDWMVSSSSLPSVSQFTFFTSCVGDARVTKRDHLMPIFSAPNVRKIGEGGFVLSLSVQDLVVGKRCYGFWYE